MSSFKSLTFALLLTAPAWTQTAAELVARNLQARGGAEKIKALRTLRATGKVQQGSFTLQVENDAMAPDKLRQNFTLQGMTAVQAYDGSTGWKIDPFGGRRDPEIMGEEELRDMVEDANFAGPLVDYEAQGNRIEFLGKETLDGDDVYRLKVTLKNGDLYYYYLDPETFLEVRMEKVQFIRGSVKESVIECGSYKLVAGVYLPFTYRGRQQTAPRPTLQDHVREDRAQCVDGSRGIQDAGSSRQGVIRCALHSSRCSPLRCSSGSRCASMPAPSPDCPRAISARRR